MEDVPAEAALFDFRSYHHSLHPAAANPSHHPCLPYYYVVQTSSTHYHRDYSEPPPQYHYSPATNSVAAEPSRFSISILSRNSSSCSRGSTNNSTGKQPAVHFKRTDVDDDDDDDDDGDRLGGIITVRDLFVKNEYENDEEEEGYYQRKRRGCFRYFRVGRNSSTAWICLQIGLRLAVSLGLALLVFYVATKPPRPTVSIQMGGIREFELGEGVDRTGIPTVILTCNFSIHILVDNKSQLFALQLHHTLFGMYFDRLLLAVSRDLKVMSVETYERRVFELSTGTKKKEMYGAGRSMQDMLESEKGLPLVFKLSFKSSFHHALLGSHYSEFHYKAQCVVFLRSSSSHKRHTQSFNTTTCNLTS